MRFEVFTKIDMMAGYHKYTISTVMNDFMILGEEGTCAFTTSNINKYN
ncbi:MAG: hypothetical protein H7282_11210 [Cytophagaceae bacterium]|nr:hypothetical protein [Cytophagaceae bacterium]